MGQVEDLSERAETRQFPKIPKNIAIIIFTILTVSGILVGAFLPDLIEGSEEEEEALDQTGNVLETLIASSVDHIEISGTVYNNIPVPTAFHVLFVEGDPSVDYVAMDTPIGVMMEYLLGEGSDYELTISPGLGLEAADYIIGSGEGDPYSSTSREVPVGLDEDEGTVVFELRIWGWK